MDDPELIPQTRRLRARWVGDVAIVELAGSIDAVSIRDLEPPFQSLVDEGGQRLAIGMGAVTTLDSSGLGFLLALLKRSRAAGGEVRLFALPAAVTPLFRVTGMVRVIGIFDDEASCVGAFANEAGGAPID